MQPKFWIGVDLDGTLAFYDRFRGLSHIGKPIPAMVKRVQRMLADGKAVKIFTARVTDDGERDVQAIQQLIGDWTERHIGQRLEATNVKDTWCTEIFDDKARQVQLNTGRVLVLKKE
jgi:hypothetical protein